MTDNKEQNTYEPKPKKPAKCQTCYFIEYMLTPFMAKSCHGPFKDVKQRLKYYDVEIKDKEKKMT